MISNLAFTSAELLTFIIGLFLLILIAIFIGRYYLSQKSASGLSEKYKSVKFSSPLVGRNKYPDVDIFTYSNQFFLLGLGLSLLITIGAFGYTYFEPEVIIPKDALVMETDIEVAPPRSTEPPPPPPPPPPPVITEVPDDEMLTEDEDIEFVDQSVEESTVVEATVIQPKTENKNEPAPPPPPPPPPVEEPEVEEIFQVVEEMPRFPGCEDIPSKSEKYACSDKKMLEFIYTNIKYPLMARENNIEGTVVVRFVVDEKGKVNNISIIKDIGAECGAEAKRIVQLMEKKGIRWYPGTQRGKPVKVWMSLPVKFRLITG